MPEDVAPPQAATGAPWKATRMSFMRPPPQRGMPGSPPGIMPFIARIILFMPLGELLHDLLRLLELV